MVVKQSSRHSEDGEKECQGSGEVRQIWQHAVLLVLHQSHGEAEYVGIY